MRQGKVTNGALAFLLGDSPAGKCPSNLSAGA